MTPPRETWMRIARIESSRGGFGRANPPLCIEHFVGNDQFFNQLVVEDRLFHNPGHIFLLNIALPDRLGINYQCGASLTLVETASCISANLHAQAPAFEFCLQASPQLSGTIWVTAASGMAGRPLIATDKNMFVKSGHASSQRSRLSGQS